MFKIFSVTFIAFIFIGCGGSNSPKINYKLFQSVDENQATLVQTGKDKRYCIRCGMDLVKYYKTSHSAEINHKHTQYCSIHCLEEHLGKGITLKNPMVVDVTTLKLIPVNSANYVVGSSKKGTMSKVSKYAFLKLEDAKKFQKLYGGKIMNFQETLDEAKKDFKYYR